MTSKSSESVEKERPKELWNKVGFHRVCGSYLYGYSLALGEAVLGLLLVSMILPIFLPFPEINGFKSMTAGVLGFWFGLMDLNLGGGGGFSGGMTRFIGQYSNSDPGRAVKYVQFYIWFQMMTGVIQVTAISIICLFYLVNTSLSYLVWFMLAQCLVQYPGMLMVMQSCLKAFQRGDKLAWVVWLQNTVFQVSVNIVCLLVGKWWGANNPQIGELMGITIWYILSQFLDDWINLLLGGYFFNRILKDKGVKGGIWDMFKPGFDRKVVKECLVFAGKQWIGGQVLGLFGWFVSLYMIVRMPNMAAWTGLMMIPAFLGHLVSHQSAMNGQVAPALSEAYNNGKKELTQYLINNVLKWYAIVTFYMFTSMVIIAPRILNTVVEGFPALGYYEAGIVMIPVVLMVDMFGPIRGLWSNIFVACDRPVPPIIINFVFTVPGYALQFLFIWLCVDLQVFPIWYLLTIPGFINGMMQMVVGFAWIQKSVIKIDYRKLFWQGILVPLLSNLSYAGVLILFSYTGWNWLDMLFIMLLGEGMGPVVLAAIMLLCMLFIFPGIFFCPFYAFYGGWDDFTLKELGKSVHMSGPSKYFMTWMYKISSFFAKKCTWRNKHPLADYGIIERQMQELTENR